MVGGLIEELVEFEEWHDGDVEHLLIGPATFKHDFGPWRKGDVVSSLDLSHTKGILTEYDNNGSVIASVKVKLVVT